MSGTVKDFRSRLLKEEKEEMALFTQSKPNDYTKFFDEESSINTTGSSFNSFFN